MNKFSAPILRLLRKINYKIEKRRGIDLDFSLIEENGNKIIYEALIDSQPKMIARLGATEMLCLYNYLGVKKALYQQKFFSYIKGETPPWWWNQSSLKQLKEWSGFFPTTESAVESFCELMITDMPECDVLGSWLPEEKFFKSELQASRKIMLEELTPFFATTTPWTKALENKKVLVVHPFTNTIAKQYKKRELLFDNNLLPHFELITLKAVQSIADEKTPFSTWFDALNYMSDQIDKVDYDICILGCGAYGFPLAAHIKRKGKKAVHLGGATQLLFGIRGKRWEDENYNKQYNYSALMNEYWVRPSEDEIPDGAKKVEGACYW